MTKNNMKRKKSYFKKNKLAMTAEMTNSDNNNMYDVTIHVVADINFDEKLPGFNIENDKEQNIVEFNKVLPFLQNCIKTFYNRKTHSIETVVLPNPYFTDVFLLTDAVDSLTAYIDSVLAKTEMQGEKVGNYISFLPNTIGVVCGE